jgi:anti-sigma regulatory factor (Ser/Thr protein kinase)
MPPPVRKPAAAPLLTEVTLAAIPASVPAVRKAIADLCARAGFRGESHRVLLAVTEAAANVVSHAYRGGDEQGQLHVQAEAGPDRVRLLVRDSGGGFRPRADSRGAGLGMALIAALSNVVEVRDAPGEGGTDVTMTFHE